MRLNVLIFLTVYELKLFLFCSSLREKCPNTEFFLVRIFLYSGQTRENTDQKNSVFIHLYAVLFKAKTTNILLRWDNVN